MGFHSSFVSDPVSDIVWPEWFRAKYGELIDIPQDGDFWGVLSSRRWLKTYGVLIDLPGDLARIMQEQGRTRFRLVFLHECGGVTRIEVGNGAAVIRDATEWTTINDVEMYGISGSHHDSCRCCSDENEPVQSEI